MFGLGLILGLFHLASAQTIEANVCGVPQTPVISAPAAGTSTATQAIEVDGTAGDNVTVNITDNGQLAASLSSDGSGTFTADIQLASGGNSLVAQVSNDCGQSASSAAVAVTYTPPPPPPPPPPKKKVPAPVTPAPAVVSIALNTNPAVVLPEIAAPTATLSGKGLGLTLVNPLKTAGATAKEARTTTQSSLFITGSTKASANIAVIVNGKVVADILSDQNGNFGVLVPLSVGKNKVQFTATLGDKTVTKTLNYTRTSPVTKAGAITTILYIGLGLIILFWLGFFLILAYRRRKKREEEARLKEGASHAPYSV